MLDNPGAEALMQDARDAYARAEALMAAGDWRDGAEKGWLAFRNAAAALVWDVTGVHNQTNRNIRIGLRKLAQDRGGQYAELPRLWGHFIHHMHSRAFYDGVYEDELPGIIREVADFIRRVEELTGNDA